MRIPLSSARLIACASGFIGLAEEGDNRGQMIERFLAEVRQPPGMPWCAAFVHHVGYWSHYDHVMGIGSWPLPATASCWELGEYARTRGILKKDPREGDVFLAWNKDLKRFAHTGIVVAVERSIPFGEDVVHHCITIEGNTNKAGEREGRYTLQRNRRLSTLNGDRVIRWMDLEAREKAA